MNGNGKPTEQKRRVSIKWVLLFSCALLICMVITFSMTLAYFGGSSDTMTMSMYLKSPLYIGKETTQSKLDLADYMIPGVNLLPTCELTVMSGNEGTFVAEAVTNAVVRLDVQFTGDMASYLSTGTTYADVYKTATVNGMTDANRVARLVKHSTDGYWYMVADTSATSVANSTLLYEVPLSSNNGVVTLMFSLQFNVSEKFTNDKGGKQATASVNFKAVQSEYYAGTTTRKTLTYENMLPVFNA